MSSPVTEIAYLTLKPGVNIFDSTSSAADEWQKVISTLQKREGYQRLRYGLSLEITDLLMLLIDWDSIESHQTFMSDPSYKPFLDILAPLTTSIHLHHATLTPFPPSLLDRVPCVEFATFYNIEPEFKDNVEKFIKAAQPDAQGCFGAVVGETVEEDVVIHGKEEKGGKAMVLAIGWQTREDHMRYRETESFKTHIHFLREKKGEGVEMFHVVPFTPA